MSFRGCLKDASCYEKILVKVMPSSRSALVGLIMRIGVESTKGNGLGRVFRLLPELEEFWQQYGTMTKKPKKLFGAHGWSFG